MDSSARWKVLKYFGFSNDNDFWHNFNVIGVNYYFVNVVLDVVLMDLFHSDTYLTMNCGCVQLNLNLFAMMEL